MDKDFFKNKKVKCNELNMVFDSLNNCGKYMIENYWDGIVLKLGEELSPLVNKIGDINTQLIRIDNRIEEWLEENNS